MRHLLLQTLLLLVACAAPERSPRPAAVNASDAFEVMGLPRGGRFDAAALEALGAEQLQWAHHAETHEYRCVGLHAVLAHCGLEAGTGGPGADPRTRHSGWRRLVRATAADGFDAVFSTAELMPEIGPSQVLVAWAKDGAPIPPPEGPLRLLVPTDKKGSRSIRQLVRIEVLDAAGGQAH